MGLHIGLIGARSVSDPDLWALNRGPLVQRVTVADPDGGAVERLSARHQVDAGVEDYRRLLDDPTVNEVDICLPHYLHHPVALEAFQAGKDVLMEKPITLTLAQADEMIVAAESTRLRFYVSLNQLSLPAVERAEALLALEKIGKPFLVVIIIIGQEERMRDLASWKGDWEQAGGGVLTDTGMHPLCVLEYFFGSPLAVTAHTPRLVVEVENKADDTALLILEYAEGLVASVAMTYAAYGDLWREERRIYGTRVHCTSWMTNQPHCSWPEAAESSTSPCGPWGHPGSSLSSVPWITSSIATSTSGSFELCLLKLAQHCAPHWRRMSQPGRGGESCCEERHGKSAGSPVTDRTILSEAGGAPTDRPSTEGHSFIRDRFDDGGAKPTSNESTGSEDYCLVASLTR